MPSFDSPKSRYEDADLAVIEKPAGWVVNRAQSVREKTIQDWVEQIGWVKGGGDTPFENRNGVVHRLDKVTSGLLIIAKNPQAFASLQDQFRQRLVEKEYLALAHGWLKPRKGEISLPVGRKARNRHEFGVFLGGRPALTGYEVAKYYSSPLGEKVSYLVLKPKSGRTHQLRVHLKYLGHPLIGDPVYGGRKNIKADARWCPRLFLHAFQLSFLQPRQGNRLTVKSELPAELGRILTNLKPADVAP